MKTSFQTVIDNAFIIKRECTKHSKEFKYNIVKRPIMVDDFFRIAPLTDIKDDYRVLQQIFSLNRFASDYCMKKYNSPMMEVTLNSAYITHLYLDGNDVPIPINREKLLEIHKFLADENLYKTDYGKDIIKDERFYKEELSDRVRIGLRIAELRKEKGLSQAKLAELTGIGSAHIARIELGRYSTGIDLLAKIAEVLEYKIDFIKK